MNILITDYYCASNRGDAAILEGLRDSLGAVYPDANITVMTEHPRAAELIHGIDVVEQVLAGFQWTVSRKNVARAYLSLTRPLYDRGLTPPGFGCIEERGKIQPYLDADVVVSTGGHHLTDVYFPDKVGVLWEQHFLARLGTPVVIYAQTLGPFDHSPYRRMTRAVLNEAELIITRDKRSKEIVMDLDVSTPVRWTADAAFSMTDRTERETPIDHLRDPLPDVQETTVSISVREWKHTDEDTTVDDYVLAVANLADWLVGEKDVNVVFASTCTGLAGYHNDDRLIAARAVDAMEHGEHDAVRILTGEYTPRQLVETYRQMDLHVGMRMHSNILAMMAETPVVAIQYQFKTEGLMEQFDLLDYVIDVNDVTGGSLRRIVADAFDERDSLSDAIAAALPGVRQASRRSARLVKKHVGDPTVDGTRG